MASRTAWSAVMTAPVSRTVAGSSEVRSEPRRSHPERSAFSSRAPDRSTSRRDEARTPRRSASRIRTPANTALDRLAWASETKDQSPPSTFSRSRVHATNRLPTSLQPVKEESKNEHRSKTQFTNAVEECAETLNRVPRKVHPSKTAPSVTTSDRSHSMKLTPSKDSPWTSRPPQSSRDSSEVTDRGQRLGKREGPGVER